VGQKIYKLDEIITVNFIERELKDYFDFGRKLKQFKEGFREEL